jgi:hypothetical protein
MQQRHGIQTRDKKEKEEEKEREKKGWLKHDCRATPAAAASSPSSMKSSAARAMAFAASSSSLRLRAARCHCEVRLAKGLFVRNSSKSGTFFLFFLYLKAAFGLRSNPELLQFFGRESAHAAGCYGIKTVGQRNNFVGRRRGGGGCSSSIRIGRCGGKEVSVAVAHAKWD